MKLPASDHVTLVEVLERTASFEEFSAAAGAAVRRLESEGVRGLVRVQFYGSPDSTEVGAILTFADPGQVMDHIRLISGWPEFKAFVGTIRPVEVRIYGRLNPEAQAWIRSMNVTPRVYEEHLAGFVR